MRPIVPDPELARLLAAYFDGPITPEDKRQLETRLRTEAEARRHYWEVARWHATLSVWGEQHSGRSVEAEPVMPWAAEPAAPAVTEASVTPLPVAPGAETATRAWWRRSWVGAVAVAACLALLLSLRWRPQANPAADEAVVRPVLATMNFANDAVWTEASAIRADQLRAGDYELQRGVVRFTTASGASVILAAPARFRLVSPDLIELQEGRLAARMLKEGVDFAVRVHELEVRDLGTSFGVDASNVQHTLVSVFEGRVAVTLDSARGPAVELVAGESLVGHRTPHSVGPVEKAAFTAEAFQDLWPLTIGINETSRLVEFLPAGPLQRPLRDYRANDRLYIFPERGNVSIARSLPLDLSPDVREWPDQGTSPYPLPAGSRVSSYMVFFQPQPSTLGPRRLSGSITFHQRIVGVICCDPGLEASDGVLGEPTVDYSTNRRGRGLEEIDKVNQLGTKLPHDELRISPDGRTLTFDFYVIDEREQMRVLVAAD